MIDPPPMQVAFARTTPVRSALAAGMGVLLAVAALAGCTHSAEHVFDDRPREDVWNAMMQVAREPRYSDWIVIENKFHIEDGDHLISIWRDLRRDIVEPGLSPRREEEQWRFTAQMLSTEPTTVQFSCPDWAIPAHFWKEADHYFAQVRMRLGEMGPVTPVPGDPLGGAPAAAAKDPVPPGHIPPKPAGDALAAP